MLSKVLTGYIAPTELALTGARNLAKAKAGKRVKVLKKGKRRAKPMVMRAAGTPWADVLNLAGEERERFEEMAWVARSPTPMMGIVKRLRDQVEILRVLVNDKR